jgi:epsilon-lactone hydrolase
MYRQHVTKFVVGTGINALVFDYRLAPEHPFPEAFEEALSAYEYLLRTGYTSSKIAFADDSAIT